MSRYGLLIFDLDGTLVPSEELATRMMGRLMAEHLGIELTPEEVNSRYMGRDMNTQYADMALMYGAPLPQSFFDAVREAWTEAVESDLEPSVGAIDALRELEALPRCIASNSDAGSIRLSLKATGLDEYFDRYFCPDDVENPKPAPDMLLLAASTMDVPPERCLVVEDSVLGIRAARAAGMDVVGYAGNGLHHADALRAEGAVVISHFSELAEIVHNAQ